MKNLKSYLACLAVFALFLTSCSKDEPASNLDSDKVATVTFASLLADMNVALNKQSEDALPACSSDTPAFAQISLTYGPSDTEVNTIVPIMMDGDGYFTVYDEDLEIPVPMDEDWVSISLNVFNVWSDDGGEPGTIIWKAPMDDSEYDQFVGDALPVVFDLRAGSKNYMDVEVLCFDDRMVNRYGYQFFDILPEEVRELCFFANYCTDEGRHYTADYNLDLYYFTGDDTEDFDINDLEVLYSDRSPMADVDGGAYYADPLCLAIPGPQMGEGAGEAYLYYEVTLTAWDDNYTFPAEPVVHTGFLSWNDIEALLDTDDDGDIEDNTDVNYWHVQLNCGTDDGGNGPVEGDTDGDGVPDTVDQCPGTPEGVTVDAVGCPVDTDEDGVPNYLDNCPNVYNPDQLDTDDDGVGDACEDVVACSIGAPDAGCTAVYAAGTEAWVEITEPDGFPQPVALNELGEEVNFGIITSFLDNGNLVVQLSMDEGVSLDDYVVDVSDANDGTSDLCEADSDIAPPTGDDPDATVIFANATASYPYYIRVKANVCSE